MTAVEGERAVGPPIDDQAADVAPERAAEPSPGTNERPGASSAEQEGAAGEPGPGSPVDAAPDALGEAGAHPPVDADPGADAAADGLVDTAADGPVDTAADTAGDGPAGTGADVSGDPPADVGDGTAADTAGTTAADDAGESAPGVVSPGPDEPATSPEPAAPAARPRWRRALGAVLIALLLTAGGGVAGAWAALTFRPAPPPPAPAPVPAPTGLLAAVDAVSPAVLRVQAGEPETGTAGTALVVTPTGDVVTNAHLVYGEQTATLIHADGRTSAARVVATDENADLAWLRIDGAQGLPVVHLAGPAAVRPGEDVVAIGNALNLDGPPSVTRGIVSAVGRSTPTLTDVIQTDAAISSGSSGGALVDRSGTVVGITTEALVGDPTVSVEDIAFAIPADRVVAVLRGMGLVLPPA
jgi:putative serine protease PepD